MKHGRGFLGKRFVLTAGCLLAVFALFALKYDVSKLEVIIPAILVFYHGTDAYEKVNRKKDDDSGNPH